MHRGAHVHQSVGEDDCTVTNAVPCLDAALQILEDRGVSSNEMKIQLQPDVTYVTYGYPTRRESMTMKMNAENENERRTIHLVYPSDPNPNIYHVSLVFLAFPDNAIVGNEVNDRNNSKNGKEQDFREQR